MSTAAVGLRILHAISALDMRYGGTTSAVAGLCAAQHAAGLRASVVATARQGDSRDVADGLERQGVPAELVGPATGPLCSHRDLVATLSRLVASADVVHIHALWEDIQHHAARIARRLAKPYVITPHGMLDPWSLRQSQWKKRIYLAVRLKSNLNHAAALHFTSPIEQDLTAPLKLKAPAIIEPNGLDLSEFDQLPPRGAFRSRFPALGDRPVILFLSRVHPKKGLDLLVPAFAEAKLGDAMLAIAGPDAEGYSDRVREMARAAGVAGRVIFTGMLHGRERIEAFVDADLFALPSYQENFGIAVAEALASGCPVVISDQVNIYRDVLAAGVGSAVPTQVAPLAAELRRWMGDDALRRDAGRRGIEFVRTHYDWNRIAGHWAGHYARLIKRSTR